MPTPVRADDTEYLMTRMEESLHATAAGFKRSGFFVCGMFALFVIISLSEKAWGAAAFCFAFFAIIFFIVYKAVKKNSPERMKPVIDAVRNAPETITVLRHYQTSDTRQVFITDWVSISTAKNQFLLKANKDWERLMAILKARCPNAKVLEK